MSGETFDLKEEAEKTISFIKGWDTHLNQVGQVNAKLNSPKVKFYLNYKHMNLRGSNENQTNPAEILAELQKTLPLQKELFDEVDKYLTSAISIIFQTADVAILTSLENYRDDFKKVSSELVSLLNDISKHVSKLNQLFFLEQIEIRRMKSNDSRSCIKFIDLFEEERKEYKAINKNMVLYKRSLLWINYGFKKTLETGADKLLDTLKINISVGKFVWESIEYLLLGLAMAVVGVALICSGLGVSVAVGLALLGYDSAFVIYNLKKIRNTFNKFKLAQSSYSDLPSSYEKVNALVKHMSENKINEICEKVSRSLPELERVKLLHFKDVDDASPATQIENVNS
jgi:hypothetical protein